MSIWPELNVERDHETLAILHLAAQMLGKIRVAHAPWMNHGWHVALQPNARGTATLPTAASEGRTFTLTIDLCRHALVLWVSDGSREEVPLNAGSVAALHQRLIAMLDKHDLPADFNGRPARSPTRSHSPPTLRRVIIREIPGAGCAKPWPLCCRSLRASGLASAERRARSNYGGAHSILQ